MKGLSVRGLALFFFRYVETSEVWSVLALEETIRLLQEIDEIIPSWPIE